MTSDSETRELLHLLSAKYAAGVDRRDLDLFLEAFASDASLTVYRSNGNSPHTGRSMTGHAEIGRVIEAIGVYAKTFHLVGQGLFVLGDGEATGEVYCVAHHYRLNGPSPTVHTMYIRYEDEYRRDGNEWKISSRTVRADWAEDRELPDIEVLELEQH